ncbi:MAG: hypothetical protein ABIJ09_10510 [Pseudomonadota bacterium]
MRPAFGLAHVVWLSGFLACSTVAQLSEVPMQAMRDTRPAGIQQRALAMGFNAPAIELEGNRGPWSLHDALAQGPAILIFYRGGW